MRLGELASALAVSLTLLGIVVAAATLFVGCARRDALRDRAHTVLNHVTDVADPLYALASVACDAKEGAILGEDGPTADEKGSEIAKVRKRCDGIFTGFEALRRAQLVARDLIERATQGDGEWGEAVAAADEAHEAWAVVRRDLMDVPWLREAMPASPARAP